MTLLRVSTGSTANTRSYVYDTRYYISWGWNSISCVPCSRT